MTHFTKTETLRRLRVLAAESRRVGGLHTGHRVEVGHRTMGVAYGLTEQDARINRFREGDDLDDFDDMGSTARMPEYRQHGAVVHLYLSEVGTPPWFSDASLIDVNCGWLGTPDHEPVLLDYNGTRL